MSLVLVPAGSFLMGNTGEGRDIAYSWCALACERPRHTVCIAEPFYIGQTEVTEAQWCALMEGWPPQPIDPTFRGGPAHPVRFVSWHDAQAYVAALTALGHGRFRLPSEAEWEYACRGPATNPHRYAPFSFGDDPACDMNGCSGCTLFDRYMVHTCSTGWPGPAPVASRLPAGFGLYDMHGNVGEWCQDVWHDDYTSAPLDGSARSGAKDSPRVVRGGYWGYGPTACRTAYRAWLPADRRDLHIGLRVVLEP